MKALLSETLPNASPFRQRSFPRSMVSINTIAWRFDRTIWSILQKMVKVIQAINCKILLERLGYRSHNSSAPWGFVSFETEGYLFICMGFFHFFFQCCYKRVYLELIWCKICLKFWPVKSLFHRPGFSRIIRIFFVSLLQCLRTDIYIKISIFHQWKGIQ